MKRLSISRLLHSTGGRIGVIFMLALVIISSTLTTPGGQAYAATQTSSLSPINMAKSFAAYRWLRSCINRGNFSAANVPGGINQENVNNFQWFSGTFLGIDSNVSTSGVINEPQDGDTSCDQQEGQTLLKTAMQLWGYSSGAAFLCDIGFTRDVGNDCTSISNGGTNNFHAPADAPGKLDSWWTSSKMGNSSTGLSSISAGGEYQLYFQSFLDKCGKESSDGEYTLQVFENGSTTPVPKKYTAIDVNYKKDSGDVRVYQELSMNCGELANKINSASDTAVKNYQKYLFAHQGNTNENGGTTGGNNADCVNGKDASGQPCSTSGSDSGKSSCPVSGIGWMICPVLNALGGLDDAMMGWLTQVLQLQPLSNDTNSPQYLAWSNIRSIANVVLVIGFIIIIFSQLTGVGVSNYGVKKTLPRLIIVAIAINVSFILMSLAVDVTNIIGVGIQSIFTSVTPQIDANSFNVTNIVGSFLTGTGVTIGGAAIGAAAIVGVPGGLEALALMLFPVVAVAVLGLLAAVATLFIRNALVIVLIVISPLALAAYLLPNTQNLFTRWRKLFVSMLMLFPLAAVLFAAAKFVAYITVQGDQPLTALAAIFIMAAPLGMLPFLIKSSNSLLGNLNGRLAGLAKSARNPLRKSVDRRLQNTQARSLAGQRNFWGRRQASDKTNMAQRRFNRQQSVEQETANARGTARENWRELGINGTGKAASRAQKALDAEQTLSTRKSALDSEYKARSDARRNTAGTSDHAYNVRRENASIESAAHEAELKEAQTARVMSNPTLANFDTRSRAAQVNTAKNEAQAQERFDQHVANNPGLTSAIQATKQAQEGSKTLQAEQDVMFDRSKLTDAGLINLQNRQDAAKRETEALHAEQKLATDIVAEQSPRLQGFEERKADAELLTGAIDERVKTDTQRRQQSDLGLLNVKLDTAASKKESEALGKVFDQHVTEAASQAGGAELVANGIDADSVSRIQDAQIASSIANAATSSAQRIQQQEFTDMVAPPSGGTTAITSAMAGIDTQHGEALAQAQAIESQRRSREGNVAAYGIRLKAEGADGAQLAAYTKDTTRAPEEREAAGRAIVDSGDIDQVVPYLNYLSEALDAAAGNPAEEAVVKDLQKAFAERIGSSPGKPVGLSAPDIANLAIGNFRTPTVVAQAVVPPTGMPPLEPVEIQTLNTVITKGVAPEGWASMDKKDIGRITDLVNQGLIPQERLKSMKQTVENATTDPRINSHIKEREMALLQNLFGILP